MSLTLTELLRSLPHDDCSGCRHDMCRVLGKEKHCTLCHRCQLQPIVNALSAEVAKWQAECDSEITEPHYRQALLFVIDAIERITGGST
jgi:hypothetical protein